MIHQILFIDDKDKILSLYKLLSPEYKNQLELTYNLVYCYKKSLFYFLEYKGFAYD